MLANFRRHNYIFVLLSVTLLVSFVPGYRLDEVQCRWRRTSGRLSVALWFPQRHADNRKRIYVSFPHFAWSVHGSSAPVAFL